MLQVFHRLRIRRQWLAAAYRVDCQPDVLSGHHMKACNKSGKYFRPRTTPSATTVIRQRLPPTVTQRFTGQNH